MTKYLSLKKAINDTLNSLFPSTQFAVELIDYQGIVSTFFIKTESQKELIENWEKISNAIAIYYQTKLETEFERWNLYLFYITSEEIDRGMQYRIENDPVSSRKILICSPNPQLSDSFIAETIASHITNTSLNDFSRESGSDLLFIKDEFLEKYIKFDTSIKAKKNPTEDSISILDNIEKAMKNEI